MKGFCLHVRMRGSMKLPSLHNFSSYMNRGVFCPIVGCSSHLKSLEDFEDHYNARHTASCSVCFRVYPTSRLLSIHVSEAHDSFFQAKVARGFAMVFSVIMVAVLLRLILCLLDISGPPFDSLPAALSFFIIDMIAA